MNNPILESIVAERGTTDQEILMELVKATDRNTAELERIHDALRKREIALTAQMREITAALRFIGNNVS